ncbi:MAG: beta-hydroxyacyl-ACP dehydratase [Hyphomicrobium sp.]|nr:beta-hydroxyacyl-ACP dehydratase [Hyphomicrobium sp.]MBN9277887.1 beta-hydroxyacyl-ACP dehydratase [Hyphomicrobium sp.]ODT30099.1 MAG: beta-hydroxyacyl-ACP dehydratase [Hyphomicrobium sp. SCN 65-11]OJU23996.1 MAG: beta-hydroxyacyl-ACP dehydratase [Alphaproteobacteria bacterium 64-6]
MRLEYFQMLDGVERLDLDLPTLVASAQVPETSPVFEGHFPGHAVMPGVLLLETMAQAAGYLMLASDGFSRMPFFAGVKKANFRAFVPPGADLLVHATRVHDGSGYAVVDTSILHGGKSMADACLIMRSVAFPNTALEQHVRSEGTRLGLLKETHA